jgi:hypothetical protein
MALISIDGAPPTAATPSMLSLPTGTHSVGPKYLGYRDTMITVSLAAASTETLTVALGPAPGTPRSFGTFCTLSGEPDGLAVGDYGPVFVTAGAAGGGRALTALSLDGAVLGSFSLGYNRTSRLAVAANGDLYLAEDLSLNSFVLSHFTSTASYSNAIYFGNRNWPGPPCAAMGSDDTLMVLSNAPDYAVIGSVRRYVADVLIDEWFTGISVYQMVVDRPARRCYFMGESDTVHVFSTGGHHLNSWKAGLWNGRAGQLAVGLDGSVYLTDGSNLRRYSGDGAPLGAWGTGGLGSIWGMGVDAQGRVYIALNGSRQVVRYVP